MKKTKAINYSDINVIACLFAGKNPVITIIDPMKFVVYDQQATTPKTGKNVLINFSTRKVDNIKHYDCIIDFSKKLTLKNYNQENFKTVIAPNGVLRYLIRGNSINFLDFYHNTTFKSTCIKIGLHILFRIRISHFIFPSVRVLSKEPFSFLKGVNSKTFNRYAIFTGTPGFWRKPVVQFCKNNTVVSYAKVPINNQTEIIINKEKNNLLDVQRLGLKKCIHPKVINNTQVLLLTNISTKEQINTSSFSSCHFNAIQELKEKTLVIKKVQESTFTRDLDTRIKNSYSNIDFQKINKNLITVFNSINKDETIELHIAHGDFTNWNTTILNNQLYCYDWEMKIDEAPLYYDVFHFFHQAATFTHNDKENIYKSVIHFINNQKIKLNTKKLKTAYILYLLDVISKNITLVNKQESISLDQTNMITNWYTSLIEITTLKN